MSANDPSDRADGSHDIESELEKTVAEAEAAVEAMHSTSQDPGGNVSGPDEQQQPSENPDPETEVTVEQELEQVKQERDELHDKWLRAVADFENYKKRVKRDIDEALQRRTQDLLQSFLPTVDNLERALEVAVAPNADAEAQRTQLVKGIEMVRNEFLGALEKHGISPIPAVGEVFDPSVHDALQQFDSPDHAPGTVIQEFEKGYRQGQRLLRPARVIVAGPGSSGGTGETPESEDE